MSDTRQDAAQEMLEAGMQSGMEDTLGSSLSSSFAPPSTISRPKPATEVGTTQAADKVEPEPEAESAPVPGMDEWKGTYEKYMEDWQAESKEARAKAEANRKKYEDEAAAEGKKRSDAEKAKKRAEAEAKRQREDAERLRKELAGEISAKGTKGGRSSSRKGGASKAADTKEERELKVKEAWEMVKAAGEGEPSKEVVTDGRGVMPEDLAAGQADVPGAHHRRPSQTMYDPTTSTEPLPPSMQPPTPSPPAAMPSESQTLSRHSATSQAWSEISMSPSSAEDLSPPGSGSGLSSEEASGPIKAERISRDKASYGALPRTTSSRQGLTSKPGNERPSSAYNEKEGSTSGVPGSSLTAGQPGGSQGSSGYHQHPPAQPPSLTLAIFTSPSHLSISRLFAVLGINLVLPFINGVMLGFGEIFAREAIKVGRLVIRGERSLFGWRRGGEDGRIGGAGGRGVAGVGLSGSGGFP